MWGGELGAGAGAGAGCEITFLECAARTGLICAGGFGAGRVGAGGAGAGGAGAGFAFFFFFGSSTTAAITGLLSEDTIFLIYSTLVQNAFIVESK